MYVRLSVAERLKDLRVERHLTLEQLAEKTGLSRSALGQYETDDYKDISPYAITTLAKFYGVSSDYLLGLSENKDPSNADIESLHLNDDMIELLKSGRINNRLLCEIALHPAFRRLMTDIEVCVDRIADMHINDMNDLLEKTREEVIKRSSPDEDDINVRTLELAQVSEDIFYSHVIHDDLDTIVKDIREAHTKDSMTADEDEPAAATVDDMQKILDDAMNYEGTIDQKRAFLVCETLKIDYGKLSEEDQDTLTRICKKSPLMLNVMNQRGKAKPQTHGKGKKKK